MFIQLTKFLRNKGYTPSQRVVVSKSLPLASLFGIVLIGEIFNEMRKTDRDDTDRYGHRKWINKELKKLAKEGNGDIMQAIENREANEKK